MPTFWTHIISELGGVQTQPIFLGLCLLAMPLLYKPSFWDRNLESVHNSELRNWESAQSGFLYYYYGHRSATGKEKQSICWSTGSTNFPDCRVLEAIFLGQKYGDYSSKLSNWESAQWSLIMTLFTFQTLKSCLLRTLCTALHACFATVCILGDVIFV